MTCLALIAITMAVGGEFRHLSPQRGEGLGVRGEARSWTKTTNPNPGTPHPKPQPLSPEPRPQDLTPLQIQIRDVIKTRTGQNGYEEYIDATVLSLDPRTRALVTFLRGWTPGVQPTITAESPEGITEKTTLLDAYRTAAREADPVFALIQKGNAKDVFYPNELSFATLFPEYSHFRAIAYLYLWAITVDLADGHAAQASARLLEGIKFARKIQTGPYIAVLVGLAMEQVMLAAVDKNPRIWPVDFGVGIAALPNNANGFKESISAEAEMMKASWKAFLAKPDEVLEKEAEIEAAKKISPDRIDALYDQILVALEGPPRKALARLDKPEAEWLKPLEPSPTIASRLEAGSVKPGEALVLLSYLRALGMFGADEDDAEDTYESMLRMAVRIRVQRRIFAHTAAVGKYRWERNELPRGLADVYGAEPLDPVNGQAYRFTRVGDSFRISLDVKGIGTVGLLGVPRPNSLGGGIIDP